LYWKLVCDLVQKVAVHNSLVVQVTLQSIKFV